MGLATAVKGSRHSYQIITWSPAIGLTGANLSGTIRLWGSTESRAIDDSAITLVGDGSTGQVKWTYGENDVAEAGMFLVKVTATFSESDKEISMEEAWVVKP